MNTKLIFASLALASLVASAQAQDPLVLAKKFAADYAASTKKKDIKLFEKSSTPDFTYSDAKGNKMTKAQSLTGMKSFFGMLTIKSLKVTAISAKKAEGGILYIQETSLLGSMKMGGPKPSIFKSDSRDEVLMVQKGGKWLTKRVKNIKTADLLDGKPMPGM